MTTHIALYKFKDSVTPEQINQVFQELTELQSKVPGLISINCAKNTSKYSEGYEYVILIQGKDQAAIDAYRAHPDHARIAQEIEAMEDKGIGVDFSTKE